jgi:hypothetical protein
MPIGRCCHSMQYVYRIGILDLMHSVDIMRLFSSSRSYGSGPILNFEADNSCRAVTPIAFDCCYVTVRHLNLYLYRNPATA